MFQDYPYIIIRRLEYPIKDLPKDYDIDINPELTETTTANNQTNNHLINRPVPEKFRHAYFKSSSEDNEFIYPVSGLYPSWVKYVDAKLNTNDHPLSAIRVNPENGDISFDLQLGSLTYSFSLSREKISRNPRFIEIKADEAEEEKAEEEKASRRGVSTEITKKKIVPAKKKP